MANYQFIDTNEVSEGAVLPSEALCFNGEYIENLINGYRTLYVKGREAISLEITTVETGNRDGATMQGKRYPARTITVGYQLIAATNEEFRAAYNQLLAILGATDAELIFNDETDKFYTGTVAEVGEVEPGRNAVNGEFEILCVDPFKYSVLEYEAQPSLDESTVLIDYGGTYKAHPILEADFYDEKEVGDDGETAGTLTGSGDCGYVAFFTENEKIIQLGDPDEVDGEGNFAASQTLVNQTFLGSTAWGTTAQKLWAVNAGYLQSNTVQTGSVAMALSAGEESANAANKGTQILSAKSTASSPTIGYKVTARITSRTADKATVVFAITTSLAYASSYFGKGYGLQGSVYVAGAWRNVTIKKNSEYWKGNSGHTVNLTVEITGLTSAASTLSGIKFKVIRTDSLGQAGKLGETACSNLAIPAQGAVSGDYFLTAKSYGTDSAHWHGPSITRTIGADAAGEVGAKNFTLTYKQKMCIGNKTGDTAQMGAFQMHITDASGKNIAGIRVYKHQNGKGAKLVFYLNGEIVNTTDIDIHYNNSFFGSSEKAVKTTTVTKTGGTVTFAVGSYKRQFTLDTLANVVARKVTFSFEQYPGRPFLQYNGLYWAKFVKHNCDKYKDIKNKFSANDIVEADCNTGEIRLNGVSAPELGAPGNDWEGFALTAGLNQIGLAYSSWVNDEYKPTFKVRYREVFL